jgi:negative regulator of replication initiation
MCFRAGLARRCRDTTHLSARVCGAGVCGVQVWTATSVPPTIAQFSETLNAAFGIMPPKACSSSSQLGQLELQPEPVPEPELQYALSVHQQDAEHTAEGHTGRHAHAQSLELGPELEQEPVVIATSETVLLAEAAQQAEAKRVLEAVTTMKELLHSQDFDAISHALDTFEQAFPSQSGPHQAEFAGVCSSLQLHWEQCLDRAKETCLRLSHSDDPREILSGLQQYEVYKETIAVERAALLARYAELTHGQAKAEQPADAGGSPAASSNPVVVTGPAITC